MKHENGAIVASAIENTVTDEGYREIYINATRISMSQWDIKLTVGRAQELKSGGDAIVNLEALIFSPQHAKAVAKNLALTIQKYEQVFGAIPEPLSQEKIQAAISKIPVSDD